MYRFCTILERTELKSLKIYYGAQPRTPIHQMFRKNTKVMLHRRKVRFRLLDLAVFAFFYVFDVEKVLTCATVKLHSKRSLS